MLCAAGVFAAEYEYPFLNPDLPIEERVADIVSRLTLEEKVSLMNERAEAVPRLGIKKYRYWNEALHGVARSGKFTVFPQAIAMAATWDPDLIREMATAISDEAWGGINRDAEETGYPGERFLTFWSPTINMARDPRWGRTPESYGEDPFLTSQIALAFVRGLQGDDPRYIKTVSTPKHFVANNEEYNRLYGNSVVSEKLLREYYFPAFRATVVEGHAQSVMGAYNALNGIPCNANKWLLTDVLRNEWGFDGFVVTDCGAPSFMIGQHHYAKDGAESAAFAVNAGVDIECGGEKILPQNLVEAVERGLLTEEKIDEAIAHIMRGRIKLGMFDPPEMNPYTKISPDVIGKEEHKLLARRVSRESIVLLKNENRDGAPLLPIDPVRIKSIAVVGSHGDYLEFGDYTGEPANPPVTLQQGVRDRAGDDYKVTYIPWSLPDTGFEPLPAAALRNAQGDPGVTVEFFDNPDFSGGSSHIRNDEAVSLKSKNLPDGFGKKPYSVRWTGAVHAERSGAHVFNVKARGTVTLTVDELDLSFIDRGKDKKTAFKTGEMIRDGDLQKPEPDLHLLVVFMEQGRDYEFTLDYKPLGKSPLLELEWTAPDADTAAARAAELDAIRNSDLVIASMGYHKEHEHEGMDRKNLGLPPGQSEYVLAALAQNAFTVVVLTNGSPLAVNRIAEEAPAILEWWLPGEQGGAAMAEVLFGDESPAGRLPFTVYKSTDDLPDFADYDITKGRTYMYYKGDPLYPFGHGLGYTSFDYHGLDVWVKGEGEDARVYAGFDLINNTGRGGEEVMQLYARRVGAGPDRPIQKLYAFKRVYVEGDGDIFAELSFPLSDLAEWNDSKKAFEVVPGDYEILVGGSSADLQLTETLHVE